jgi:hypothetical protein
MDGWKGRLEQGVEKGKGVTPGTWTTRSNIQITDKRKRTNKEQRRQERMYSTGVDYSTLSISSLHRHDEDTVLLPSPPAGATSNMDKATVLLPSAPPGATPDREKAQTTTEGQGEEDRHDRPGTPCHHGGNAGGVNIVTSGRNGEGTIGT